MSGRGRERRPRKGATIVPIEELTREATFRRLAELARRTDPPPPEVARTAMSTPDDVAKVTRWRSVDDELASLVYDSEQDLELYENVRSLSSSRRLTFEASELMLEVEVTLGRPRELACQVVPPQPAVLEVRTATGSRACETDGFGTFHVSSLPPGPVSLRCSPLNEGGEPVATSWFRI